MKEPSKEALEMAMRCCSPLGWDVNDVATALQKLMDERYEARNKAWEAACKAVAASERAEAAEKERDMFRAELVDAVAVNERALERAETAEKELASTEDACSRQRDRAKAAEAHAETAEKRVFQTETHLNHVVGKLNEAIASKAQLIREVREWSRDTGAGMVDLAEIITRHESTSPITPEQEAEDTVHRLRCELSQAKGRLADLIREVREWSGQGSTPFYKLYAILTRHEKP